MAGPAWLLWQVMVGMPSSSLAPLFGANAAPPMARCVSSLYCLAPPFFTSHLLFLLNISVLSTFNHHGQVSSTVRTTPQ